MSNITTISTRAVVVAQNRLASRNEAGQSSSEYGIAILVAIALGLAIMAIVTSGSLDAVVTTLLQKVLQTAGAMVK